MKKLLLVLCLVLGLVGCSNNQEEENVIKVSATLDPHSKILEVAKDILADEYGYELEIIILDDYAVFNRALDNGEVDANYFQHIPYFEEQVASQGYDIVNVGGVHIEPFGFYSSSIEKIDQLKDGDTIVISNSVADHWRLLAILEKEGLIKLDPSVNKREAVTKNIVENELNLKFVEIKPELLTTALKNNEGALVAINGNYAIAAGLNPLNDSIILEKGTSDNPYVNIVAAQTDHKDDPKVVALYNVLKSDEVCQFIEETYQGSVIVAE